MSLAPFPWDWVAWFIGFVVFVAMLFSEQANAFWARLIDKA